MSRQYGKLRPTMSETLYRKYRPATFGEVCDQNHIKTTLQNQLKQGTVAHAYIFAGPRGVGKTTLARILAKAVNCLQLNDGEPCGNCVGCLAVSQGKTMDVFEIDAASHTGVDNVRENIIDGVRFAPSQLKKKVYIIDEVHALSPHAFSALLKTLEEPPAHALFILATTELHKVPATILSRCQRFDFHRLSAGDIVERLKWMAKQEAVKIDDDVLSSIARLSEGCLRDAESLLGQILAIGDGKKITMAEASLVIPATDIDVVLRYIEAVTKKQSAEAIKIVVRAVEAGTRVAPLEDEILEALRWALLASLGDAPSSKMLDIDACKRLQSVADAVGSSGIQHLIQWLIEYRAAYRNERIPQLPLELLAVQYSGQTIVGARHAVPEAPKQPTTDPSSTPPLPPDPTPSAIKSSLSDIKGKWSACCQKLTELSGTLPMMLQDVELLGLEGGTLRIGTKVSFIADKLNENKNRQTIGAVLGAVFSEPIGIVAEVIAVQQDELVSELLGEFGGQVIS